MTMMDAASLTKQLNAHARATHSNAMAKEPGVLEGLFGGWLQRRRLRRDENWLKSQPDYMLRDIGISRAEIETVVRLGRFR